MRNRGGIGATTGPARFCPDLTAAMWTSLVPLMLLLHPYAGLVQDARIYIGRGLADRDPGGIGRDVMFANDGQTGFSLVREVVDASLSVMGPASTSMILALAGVVVWLVAAAAVARALTGGRAAWAVAVCMIALPTCYGAFGVFNYTEAIATPRLFAQAAVLGGLAASITGRQGVGAALLALAVALHPLIALPGVAVGTVLLVRRDRRWLLAAVAGGLAILGAALIGVPLASRLLQPVDEAWLSVLRHRSTYLFPTLWPAETYGPILCQATAVVVASALSRPAVRALLLAASGVSAAGFVAAWLLGDLYASTLVTQLQPWRALWLLAVFGNAALALSVIALWRRGTGARLLAAPLLLAWLWSDNLAAVGVLSALTLAWLTALMRGTVPPTSRLIASVLAGTVCTMAIVDVVAAAAVGLMLFRSAQAEAGGVVWPMIAALQIHRVPVVAAALAAAVVPLGRPSAAVRAGLTVALGCSFVLAAWLWDGRAPEQSLAEREGGDPALRTAVGSRPGEVLWIDEDSESWFLLHRPSFLNTAQAGPILFSRDLAMEWASRIGLLTQLGMVRPDTAAPWEAPRTTDEIALSPDGVRRFCADERHPVAIVAPGDQRAAAPPGTGVDLWRPSKPLRRLVVAPGAFHWRTLDAFTVVRCPTPPSDRGAVRVRDGGWFG